MAGGGITRAPRAGHRSAFPTRTTPAISARPAWPARWAGTGATSPCRPGAFPAYVPARFRSWIVRFESVNYDATVWLNGREIGHHDGAYLPFEFALKGLRPGVNRLVIRVDDRRNAAALPPGPGGGWWNFGGLQREVYLRAVAARRHLDGPGAADPALPDLRRHRPGAGHGDQPDRPAADRRPAGRLRRAPAQLRRLTRSRPAAPGWPMPRPGCPRPTCGRSTAPTCTRPRSTSATPTAATSRATSPTAACAASRWLRRSRPAQRARAGRARGQPPRAEHHDRGGAQPDSAAGPRRMDP